MTGRPSAPIGNSGPVVTGRHSAPIGNSGPVVTGRHSAPIGNSGPVVTGRNSGPVVTGRQSGPIGNSGLVFTGRPSGPVFTGRPSGPVFTGNSGSVQMGNSGLVLGNTPGPVIYVRGDYNAVPNTQTEDSSESMVGRKWEAKIARHHDETDNVADIEEDSCCFPLCQRRSSSKIPVGDRPERKPRKLICLILRNTYV